MEIFVLTSHAKDVWVASHEGVGERYGEESVCVREVGAVIAKRFTCPVRCLGSPDSVCMQVLTS